MRGQRHAPAALYPGKDPVPIVKEAGWAPGTVWTGAENLAPPPGFDPRTTQPYPVAIPTELPGPAVIYTGPKILLYTFLSKMIICFLSLFVSIKTVWDL